ncbi:MAG: recombinase RecA [Candidatus Methanoperedens sp.]|nr:recombinase RecA [Candidatus Methanoperedens sp.]MCE8427195.1 recombinase RecA [Candidatus Methanoperedens sp.]
MELILIGKEKYSLGIKELDDAIGGIKKGSNIILMGHPMSGKEVILNHAMHASLTRNENAAIIVSTREPAMNIVERFRRNKSFSLSRIGLVDCVSKTLEDEAFENGNIKKVISPADLTSIGVKISQFFEDFFGKNINNIQLHINSLSIILMYSNIQTVFRFLHILTGRIKVMGALGIYVVDSGVHDLQTIATLKQLCDGIIEVKSENDRNLLRIVGLSTLPTSWYEYEIEEEKLKIIGKI